MHSTKRLSLGRRVLLLAVAGSAAGFLLGIIVSGSLPVALISAVIAPFPVLGVYLRTRYMAHHFGWRRPKWFD